MFIIDQNVGGHSISVNEKRICETIIASRYSIATGKCIRLGTKSTNADRNKIGRDVIVVAVGAVMQEVRLEDVDVGVSAR